MPLYPGYASAGYTSEIMYGGCPKVKQRDTQMEVPLKH